MNPLAMVELGPAAAAFVVAGCVAALVLVSIGAEVHNATVTGASWAEPLAYLFVVAVWVATLIGAYKGITHQ